MRALTMDEVGSVSGGSRPWNPYTDFKSPEQSEAYWRYEAMINMALKEAGLDYNGNPIDGSGPTSDIPSLYGPPTSNPSGSVTIGNDTNNKNALSVQGSITYTTQSGSNVTGTLTIPVNGGAPTVGVGVTIPF